MRLNLLQRKKTSRCAFFIAVSSFMGAHPRIRNSENQKLLALLGRFTLISTKITGAMSFLVIFVFARFLDGRLWLLIVHS
jgi:hypothetical protein